MTMSHASYFLRITTFFLCCAFFLFSCASATSNNSKGSQDTLINNLGVEYYLLAEEYVTLDQYDKALELFQKVLNTGAKTEGELAFKIARTAALAKNWELALENYNVLLLLDPNNIAVAKSIAWIYAQKGDIELSRSQYADLYVLHSYDKEICTNYILVLLALDQFNEAKTVLEAYTELYPEAENLEELNELFLGKEESQNSEDNIKSENDAESANEVGSNKTEQTTAVETIASKAVIL